MNVSLVVRHFAGPPSFSLGIPGGWAGAPAEAPDVLAAVMSAGPLDAFRANVVVSVTEHEAPVDLSAVAAGVRRRLAELARAEVFGEEHPTVDGIPAHLIRVSYVHPAAGSLVQSVLTVPVQDGHVIRVLDVVGTAAAGRVAEDMPAVDAAMRSLRVS
jgi:hypothetical protein